MKTDPAEKINLGSAPPIVGEMWAYNIRPSEVLDAAGVEVISVDESYDNADGEPKIVCKSS